MSERTKFTVGGTEILLSREDVEQRLALVQPETIRELFVVVEGREFPIKQALADATGLHRGSFTSHDAMRIFRKLSMRIGPDSATWSERYFTVLKSLNEYDKKEVHGVVTALLTPTDRDNCFLGIYRRSKANIESLLSLRFVKDFQAIAMITRNLFELAIDLKLIDVIPQAVQKIAAFTDVERLRAAERIVAFKIANPNAKIDTSIHAQFIAGDKGCIDAERKSVWGAKRVEHWSGLKLRDRTKKLGHPFEETYEVRYPQLSWYAHSAGLAGFHLKAATYELLATSCFQLAGEFYIVILTGLIDEFTLAKADPKIKDKMKFAQQMPFTDTEDELASLERELLG